MSAAVVRGGLAALALTAVGAGTASAHVTVQPASSRPADLQVYRLVVPNEREVATVGVDVQVPAGVDFALIEEAAGWRTEVVRKGGRIVQLRWSGGRIEPDGFRTFHFIARNPVRQQTVAWKALQRYAGRDVVRWIGGPDSETPASRTRISESAVPQDVVSVHGEDVPTAAAAAAPAAVARAADEDDGERDALTLGLVIVALVVALAALASARLTQRR